MEELNTLNEIKERESPQSSQDKNEGVQNLQRVILIVAVAVMYLSYIWLPFFISKYNEGYGLSLWEMFKMANEDNSNIKYQICLFILLFAPAISLAFGLLNRSFLKAVAIIQLAPLYYLSHDIDVEFLKMSGGFYFYLIASIGTFFVGLKRANDSKCLAESAYARSLMKAFSELWFFVLLNNIENNLFPSIVQYKNIAGRCFLSAVFVGVVVIIIPFLCGINEVFLVVVLALLVLIGLLFFLLFPVFERDIVLSEKIKYGAFIGGICVSGYLCGLYIIHFILFLILVSIIRVYFMKKNDVTN